MAINKEDIQKKLIALLSNDNDNIDEILKLSSELADADNDRVRFSVDGGLIERLGIELVAKQETALSELIKNAYDADATSVEVVFENTEKEKGTLRIKDNGLGMNREQLVKGFMRISSTDKIENPVSPIFKRQRAGRKGIGRFSTQRLGENLVIITQTKDSDIALKLSIDWELIYKGHNLNEVSFAISEIPKKRTQGTTLFIKNLREKWSDASIRRAYRYILELLQPFPISQDTKAVNFDYGFDVAFSKLVDNQKIAIADEQTMIYDLAIAEISGVVDEDANGSWFLKSKEKEIGDKIQPVSYKLNHLKNIKFKAYYYLYDRAYLSPMQISQVKTITNQRGGIRLYRNGFRVLPYGEQGNDWIGLDKAAKGRSFGLAPIGNINFIGFVEIRDIEGNLFNETASREGLIENDAFIELTKFVLDGIEWGIAPEEQHHKKYQEQNKMNFEIRTQIINKNVDRIEKTFLEVIEKTNLPQAQKDELKKSIPQLTNEIKQDIKENMTEANTMRVLASVGQSIGEFTHEIRQYMPKFQSQLGMLNLYVQGDKGKKALRKLSDYFLNFKTYTSFFDETISAAVIRELKPIDLVKTIAKFKNIIKNDLEKAEIVMDIEYKDSGNYITTKMHESEWFSILMNFYSNARKAIAKKKQKEPISGLIKIILSKRSKKINIEFWDNGKGILPENQARIFAPFWTTSIEDGFQGTGLGLAIVYTIINSYGGRVYVDEPSQSKYITSIKVEIPELNN